MAFREPYGVVVVKYEEGVQPGVSRCALKHRWPVWDARSNESMTRQVFALRPRVLVLQVPHALGPVVEFLDRLRRHWSPVPVLAIASDHSAETEARMRQAGASCLLGPEAGQAEIEEALASLAPGSIAAA